MTAPSKTFCILPWIHLHPQPNGSVYQCCVTDHRNVCGTTTTHTLPQIWNNNYMRGLRTDLLAGVEHPGCSRCWVLEGSGLHSFRQSANKNFEKHIDDAVKNTTDDGTAPFQLLYWDFRFSNLCNLKCRMCGHGLSSTWYDDHVEMQRLQGRTTSDTRVIHIDDHSVETVGKYIDEYCDVVEEVYFAGGEPLIMPEHYYILEQLIARGRTDVRIRYNTNLSKLSHKHWDVLKLWDKFSNVHIFASLDALGTRAEYIRAGTVWRNIERNIDTILQWRKDSLGVNVTVQASNVWEVPTLLDWLDSRGIEHHKMLISNIVTYPQYYSLQILPQEFKDAVADRLLTHLHSKNKSWVNHFKSQVDGVIQFMNNTPPNVDRLRQQFVNITNTLDKIRNQSFIEECPELAWWWHELTGVSNT